jgi:glucose/arabinose dehydrogenase
MRTPPLRRCVIICGHIVKQLGLILFLLAAGNAACGGSGSPPSSSNPPSGGNGGGITGRERMGWDQSATDGAQLATFRYAAYVDNNRVELNSATCGGVSNGTAPCSSPLPPLSNGSHTLELVAYVTDAGSIIESSRSAPLTVTVTGDTAPAGGLPTPTNAKVVTSDGAQLDVNVITAQVESPTALVFAPDGRGFVAERQGSIRILRGVDVDADPAIALADVSITSESKGGLIGLAIDPQFDRTHYLFALYTTAADDGSPQFRVARFREAGGRLGERVVLIDKVPAAAQPSGSLGIGPDGKLYVALDDGGNAAAAETMGSDSGKILRLNTDGSTPDDRPSRNPVYDAGYRSPRGLDWQPSTGALWIANNKSDGAGELRIVVGSGGGNSSRAATVTRALALPPATDAQAIVFYRGSLVPQLRGNLLVAGRGHLLRIQLNPRDSTRILSTEELIPNFADTVSLVAVGPDGAVYIGAERALIRVTPE